MKQLVHVVGTPLLSPSLGLPGLDGATELNPDSGGDVGEDCGRMENICCANPAAFGVELVRGIFRLLGSLPRFRISLTDAAEP